MLKNFVLICLFLSFFLTGFGQADSLTNLLESAIGEKRIELLNQLSFDLAQSYPDESIQYADEALELSRDLGYEYGEAISHQKKALIYRYQGFYDKSLAEGDSALNLAQEKDFSLLASIYVTTGVCYRYKSEYESSLSAFQKALEYQRKAKNRSGEATVLNSMGVVFMTLEDYEKALNYYSDAMEVLKETKNLKEEANVMNNFAIVYANQGALDSALVYFERSLEIEEELGNEKGISESINNIGAVHYYMGNIDLAINAFRKSYTSDSLLGNEQGMVVSANNIAEMYNASDRPAKAVSILKSSIRRGRKIDSKYDVGVAYLNLAESYSALGEYKSAFETYQLYAALQDTLMGEKEQETIAELETRFQTREKENLIRIQDLELEEQATSLKARRNLILALAALIILLLIAVGFGYTIYRTRQEARLQKVLVFEKEKQLEAIIEATETERKRIARELHDGIGQQLSGIKLGLMNVVNTGGYNESLVSIQKVVDESARDVRELSHQMMPKALTELGLVPALDDMLSKSLGLSSIPYNFEVVNVNERLPEKVEINLFRIAQELVNNILKHAKASNVEVELMQVGKMLVLLVADNGIGISDSIINKDSGHGWMNIETRLKSLNATWDKSSENGGGTKFNIRIPLNS